MALFYRLRSYPPNLVVGALHQVAEAAFPRKETFSTYRLNVISPRAPASACSCAICSVQTCRILYRRTPQTLWQSVWERPEDSLGHSFGMTSVSAAKHQLSRQFRPTMKLRFDACGPRKEQSHQVEEHRLRHSPTFAVGRYTGLHLLFRWREYRSAHRVGDLARAEFAHRGLQLDMLVTSNCSA